MISDDMKSFFDQMPGACGCKDLNSVFIYANQEYVNIIGLTHKEDIIGRTDFDMPCDTINATLNLCQLIQQLSQPPILNKEKNDH